MTNRTRTPGQSAQEDETARAQDDGGPAAPRAHRASRGQEEHAMGDRDVKPPNVAPDASEPAFTREERLRRGPLDGLEAVSRWLLAPATVPGKKKVSLPLLPPPRTRAGCGEITRPDGCDRTGCRANLATVEEHGGRPYASTAASPAHATRRHGRCVLDLVDDNPDGMTTEQIAEELGCTPRRALQLEDRAMAKAQASSLLVDALKRLRAELPVGFELVTSYPRSHDSAAVYVLCSIRVPSMPTVAHTGLRRNRRRDLQAMAPAGKAERRKR